MSYSGLGGDLLLPVIEQGTLPLPAPHDYLTGGPGLAELHRVGAATASILVSGQGGNVRLVRSAASDLGLALWIPANPVIATIWKGHENSALALADVIVRTFIVAQATLPSASRKSAYLLSYDVVGAVASKLYNGGDPSICLMDFEASLKAWVMLYPVIPASLGGKTTSTGWCERAFLVAYGGGGPQCQLAAACKLTLDSAGNPQAVAAPPPPPGAIVSPSTAPQGQPQPPPTRAQIDAAVAAAVTAKLQAQATSQAQAQAELATYLGVLAQARNELMQALGLPANSSDVAMWAALKSRNIDQAEALDWVTGCDGDLNCFRQRMNVSLGEAAQRTVDARAKRLVVLGVLGAVAFAAYVYRGRR